MEEYDCIFTWENNSLVVQDVGKGVIQPPQYSKNKDTKFSPIILQLYLLLQLIVMLSITICNFVFCYVSLYL